MAELVETLASYVPRLIVRRLLRDPTPIAVPQLDRFSTAVIFIDISGFTTLTETLVQSGPAGLEALTQILNAYFGQITDLILARGGDVLKFAGDALLAVWPMQAHHASLETATLQAARCALAIQEFSQAYTTQAYTTQAYTAQAHTPPR